MCDKSTTLSRKIQLLRPKKDILDIPANHLTQRFHFYPTHPGCLTQDIFNIKQAVIRFQKQAFIGDYLHRFIGIIFPKRKLKPFLQQLYRLLSVSTKAMPYPRLLGARFFFHTQQFFHCFHAVDNQRQTELFRQLYLFLKHR